MSTAQVEREAVRIQRIELGDERLEEFERLPWRLYKGDPHWTPPLRMDLLGNRLLKVDGLLTPEHTYHKHADVTHFLAYRGDRIVGRVSAAINHRFNEFYDTKVGNFGFFECEDDQEAANALFDAARDWVAELGMDTLRGPGEYSNVTHERQGLLIDGFDTDPMVELTHNPPYYQRLVETYGFEKAMDYHAHMLDVAAPENPRLRKAAALVRKRRDIHTRCVDMKRFVEDVRQVITIYNEAWARNWGFLPITQDEADVLAETLKPIIDPGLVRFAYVDGDVAAVLGAFPDPNYALKPRWGLTGDSDAVRLARLLRVRRHIPRVRLMFFGIRPGFRRMGIDAVLFEEVLDHARSTGVTECDISMLLETNDLVIRAAEFMGAERYKTWRIYDLPLS
jgi:GNAT superfamily N-acetyltransferase